MSLTHSNKHLNITYQLVGISYERVYSKLKEVLTTEELMLFAKPKNFSKKMVWSALQNGSNKSYTFASDIEKDEASELLREAKEAIIPKLKADRELSPIAEKLFVLPTLDELILFDNGDGSISLCMMKWACSTQNSKNTNPLSMVVRRPVKDHTDVSITATYSDGSLYARAPFQFEYKERLKDFKTTDKGTFTLGTLKNGSSFSISDGNEINSPTVHHLTVISDQTVYAIVFPYYIRFDILIVNQEGEPVANAQIQTEYNGTTQTYTSNNEGIVDIPQVELKEGNFTVSEIGKTDNRREYTLEKETSQLEFEVYRQQLSPVQIKVVDENQDVVKNYPLEAGIDDNSTNYETDSAGLILLGKLEVGKILKVIDGNEPTNTQEYTIEKGENELVFQIQKPIPPEVPNVNIKLINHKNKPMPAIPMDFTIGGTSHKAVTNNEGLCTFSQELFTDKEKVAVGVSIKKKNGKEKIYNKRFTYKEERLDYTIKMRRFNWLWLLLLLPLLLLIRCEKEIQVEVVNSVTENPIDSAEVSLQYQQAFVFDKGCFFTNDTINLQQKTDNEGKASFAKLKYSIYSYIFHHRSRAIIQTPANDCYASVTVDTMFHKIRNKSKIILKSTPILADLDFKIIDKDDREPLPNAKANIEVEFSGKIYKDTATSDAAGRVVFNNLPKCGVIKKISGALAGYRSDSLLNKSVFDLVGGDLEKERTLELEPIKKKLVFFVEDCNTGRRLPGAEVVIIIEHNGKNIKQRRKTNVNGVGKGFYDDAHIIADVILEGSLPPYYKNGKLPTYKVGDFVRLPDSLRTICLEPLPNPVVFRNLDSLTNLSLAGVENIVTIENNGKIVSEQSITSDANGEFVIAINPGDIVSIVSKFPPDYNDNTTKIKNADGIKLREAPQAERDVLLSPKTINMLFRTVNAKDLSTLVPGADLQISLNIQGRSFDIGGLPNNSGTGEFTVSVPITSNILIVASKEGYGSNDTKVNNRSVRQLSLASQDERDIPLKKNVIQKPRKFCQVFVSGKLVNDTNIGSPGFSEIYVVDDCSEYVGEGEYPDNMLAFPNAHSTSFDGIAIDKGTRVIIYSNKDFEGEILLDKSGPALINNKKWKEKGDAPNWRDKVFKSPLQSLFPKSTRSFSESDMNSWSNGSMKIICNQ